MSKKKTITAKVNVDIVYVLEDDKIIGCVDLTMRRLKGEFSTYSRTPEEENNTYEKLHQAWEEIAASYKEFKTLYKKSLFNNYNIDCGTDYANYFFNCLGLEH